MAFQFTPSDGYRNTVSFPTKPANETAFRASMQELLDQVAEELNNGSASAIGLGGSLRQSIINGDFSVNQRVKSGTVVLTVGQYGHDRWRAGASGCTYTFSTSANVTTITISAGSLIQVIEGLNLYSGTYTLSWTGTSQGKIGSGSFGASGITGAVTGGSNLSIEFNTGTLSKVQFNVGDSPLPFQKRSFGEELLLCQRYFEKSYDYASPAGALTSIGCENVVVSTTFLLSKQDARFKVRKRTTPTIGVYSPQTGALSQVAEYNASSSFVSDRSTGANAQSEASFQIVSTSGSYVVGNFERFHWTADAEI